MKKLMIAALALTFAGNAFAIDNEPDDGLTFQGNIGMTTSTITGLDDFGAKIGLTVGAKAEYMLPGAYGAYFNAGVDWTVKGASKSYDMNLGTYGKFDHTSTSTLHYLQIPIHVGFRYNLTPQIGLYGEFGPYFAVGIYGHNTVSIDADGSWVAEYESDYNLFSKHDNDPYFQIWDFGLGYRVGAEYDNHYSISMGMDWGITDMYRDKYRDKMADLNQPLDKTHNYCMYLTLGYRF